MSSHSAKNAITAMIDDMVSDAVRQSEGRRGVDIDRDTARYRLERAASIIDRVEGLGQQSVASLEGIDVRSLKRSMPVIGTCNSRDEITKPGTVRILQALQNKVNSASLNNSKTRTGPFDSSDKQSPAGNQITDSLAKYEPRRTPMDAETPIGARFSSNSLHRLQRDSENGRMSSSSRGSIELRHPKIMMDKGDVCDCPNHSRTSLSLCRQSLRKSTPLQEVKEKSDCEEDSIHDNDSKAKDFSYRDSPVIKTSGNPFDIERQGA